MNNEARLARRKVTNTQSLDGLPGLKWAQEGFSALLFHYSYLHTR